MIIGNKKFEGKTYVLAIINLTPDSFFEDSRKNEYTVLKAVEKAEKEGAAAIDLGPQSTRPGYIEVSAEEEIRRLEKPLLMIKERFSLPVSVDTYFSKTAEAALTLGADMINDIWGLKRDKNMAQTCAEHNSSVCLMHNSEKPLTGDIFPQIIGGLKESLQIAKDAGIDENKICLDGGIGFAKDREQNFELLNGYDKLSVLGYPLLLGASRKSMFGGKPEDRLQATLQSTYLAAKSGVLFVRVHDVKENTEAIERAYEN